MKVLVQGTNNFENYQVFMRAMGVALASMHPKDKQFEVYSVGPHKVNDFASGFCNLTENSLKHRGVKIIFHKIPNTVAEEKIHKFDYVAFFSSPNESRWSRLAHLADEQGVDLGIFRF